MCMCVSPTKENIITHTHIHTETERESERELETPTETEETHTRTHTLDGRTFRVTGRFSTEANTVATSLCRLLREERTNS